jgi:hypothetical protein
MSKNNTPLWVYGYFHAHHPKWGPYNLQELAEKANSLLAEEAEGKIKDASYCIEDKHDYNYVCFQFRRPETEKEMSDRLAKEAINEEFELAKQKALYETLKKKFEG